MVSIQYTQTDSNGTCTRGRGLVRVQAFLPLKGLQPTRLKDVTYFLFETSNNFKTIHTENFLDRNDKVT